MAPDSKGPLLDLNTLIVRPVINIDGQEYELVHPAEMTVLDRHRQFARGRRIAELMVKKELSPAEQVEFSRVVDEATRAIGIGIPDEIHVKLRDGHRFDIIDAFGGLLLKRRTVGVAEESAT